MIHKYRQSCTERGATLLQLTLVLPVVLIAMVGTLDFSRRIWLQTMVRSALMESARVAQSTPSILQDVWNMAPDDPRFTAFREARAKAVSAALESKVTDIFSGVKLVPLTHFDRFSTGTEAQEVHSVAYLPPGYRAYTADWGSIIYNSHRCIRPYGSVVLGGDGDNDDDDNGDDDRGIPTAPGSHDCPPNRQVDVNNPDESLSKLSQIYPTEVVAMYEAPSILWGTVREVVKVGFYPQPKLAFQAQPTVTPTAAPIVNTPAAAATATPQPAATATATPQSASGSQNASSTQTSTNECLEGNYQLRIEHSGRGGDISVVDERFLQVSCIQQVLDECGSNNRASGNRTDDCVADAFSGEEMWERDRRDFDSDGNWDGFTTHYMDANCNPVQDPVPFCDTVHVAFWCPVALEWEPGAASSVTPVLSTFKVGDQKGLEWYEWRGSDAAPLLVYDPAGTGTITSPEQLFGNFTKGARWANGYDAMASFDQNRDGVLRGSELHGIALWFDGNRDGVSQPGEVKTLDSLSVTALSVKSDGMTTRDKFLSSVKGYERTVNGRSEWFSTFDWLSRGYHTKAEALKVVHAGEAPPAPQQVARAKGALPEDYQGGWVWKMEGNLPAEGGPTDGLLLLRSKGDAIEALSVIETPVKSNSKGVNSVVQSIPSKGSLEKRDGSEVLVLDSVEMDGRKTISRITLSKDRRTLHGESTLTTRLQGSTLGAPEVSYRWSATRMN